jgi:hypothetical protein
MSLLDPVMPMPAVQGDLVLVIRPDGSTDISGRGRPKPVKNFQFITLGVDLEEDSVVGLSVSVQHLIQAIDGN